MLITSCGLAIAESPEQVPAQPAAVENRYEGKESRKRANPCPAGFYCATSQLSVLGLFSAPRRCPRCEQRTLMVHDDRLARARAAASARASEQSQAVSRFIPVSYTHLDVYKRQVLRPMPRVCAASILRPPVCASARLINTRSKACVSFSCTCPASLTSICLLYTSRCV